MSGRHRWPPPGTDYSDLLNARVRIQMLEAAILDIDAHATPLGEDTDGFVATGYLISVGCLHRALGVVNGSVPAGKETGDG